MAIEEDKTGFFSVMGGFGGSGGLSGTVTIGDANFLGTGDIAKASGTIGQYARGFDVSLTDPNALGPHVSLGGQLFANETLASPYQSYNSTFYGAKIITAAPLNEQLGMSWSYSIYNQNLSTLDNPKSPTSGARVQTNNEFAGLGGAAKFARTTEDARYYHEIFGDVTGMARAQGGYVAPWGGQSLPLLNGFFGGPQLIRGFAPNGFGPRVVTPGVSQDNVGGNVYWTTTAELQAPVPFVPGDAGLKMALFSDAGSLWATNASSAASLASLSGTQVANTQAIRASVGASLIWDSPFGPLRVDYAYPIAKQSYDVTQRLNFTAGAF